MATKRSAFRCCAEVFPPKNQTMQHHGRYLWLVLLMAGFCFGLSLSARGDVCAICGKPISKARFTSSPTRSPVNKKRSVPTASNCPVVPSAACRSRMALQLPDGRYLCARDAKTVVLKADDARQICGQVKDDLDRLFSRFTSFPTNVDVIGHRSHRCGLHVHHGRQ